MRLDKFISHNASVSRTEVRRLIKAKTVTVNGVPVRDAAAVISPSDTICVDGAPVTSLGDMYLMLHKPAGYICANEDGDHPTVVDLLTQASSTIPRAHELQIAGRLDLDTTGLVLLTSDGNWNHRLTSPRAGCRKVYQVTLTQPFDVQTKDDFADGIALRGEKKPTLPARIQMLDAHRVLLTIQEGKYHQVKRMFAATGNHVAALHRLSIGDIHLDPTLQPGEFRTLTDAEIESVSNPTPQPSEQ